MKIRVSFDVDYQPSHYFEHEDFKDYTLAQKWLSDYDFSWMVEDGVMSNVKAEEIA